MFPPIGWMVYLKKYFCFCSLDIKIDKYAAWDEIKNYPCLSGERQGWLPFSDFSIYFCALLET